MELDAQGKDFKDATNYVKDEFKRWVCTKQRNAVATPMTNPGKQPVPTLTPEKEKLNEFCCHRRLDMTRYPIISKDFQFLHAMLNVTKLTKYGKFYCVFDLDNFIQTQ